MFITVFLGVWAFEGK